MARPRVFDVANLSKILRIDERQALHLLKTLLNRYGAVNVCAWLGIENDTLYRTLHQTRWLRPMDRRLIWFIHSMLLHPERCSSVFNILTWGKFAVPKKRKKGSKPSSQLPHDTTTGGVPEEWSGWDI